jgi:hypothetical protein
MKKALCSEFFRKRKRLYGGEPKRPPFHARPSPRPI